MVAVATVLPSPASPSLPSESPHNVMGLPPDSVVALATIGLFFVGAIGILTSIVLALSARKSNKLQREELDLLTTQLELTRQEMTYRQADKAEDRARAELQARVHLELAVSGGQYSQGTPPHNVKVGVTATNAGPGVAKMLTYGIRRGQWEKASSPTPVTLGAGKWLQAQIDVPDEAVADSSMMSSQGDPLKDNFTPWARYSDATDTWWLKEASAEPQRIDRPD